MNKKDDCDIMWRRIYRNKMYMDKEDDKEKKKDHLQYNIPLKNSGHKTL